MDLSGGVIRKLLLTLRTPNSLSLLSIQKVLFYSIYFSTYSLPRFLLYFIIYFILFFETKKRTVAMNGWNNSNPFSLVSMSTGKSIWTINMEGYSVSFLREKGESEEGERRREKERKWRGRGEGERVAFLSFPPVFFFFFFFFFF
jgi:hypothetical protein